MGSTLDLRPLCWTQRVPSPRTVIPQNAKLLLGVSYPWLRATEVKEEKAQDVPASNPGTDNAVKITFEDPF